MMKSGDPMVAPIPIAKRVVNPYVGFICGRKGGLLNFTLKDSGTIDTSVIPVTIEAMDAMISVLPENRAIEGLP